MEQSSCFCNMWTQSVDQKLHLGIFLLIYLCCTCIVFIAFTDSQEMKAMALRNAEQALQTHKMKVTIIFL